MGNGNGGKGGGGLLGERLGGRSRWEALNSGFSLFHSSVCLSTHSIRLFTDSRPVFHLFTRSHSLIHSFTHSHSHTRMNNSILVTLFRLLIGSSIHQSVYLQAIVFFSSHLLAPSLSLPLYPLSLFYINHLTLGPRSSINS